MTGDSPIDFARSRAILVATGEYRAGLDQMSAAINSYRTIEGLLTGPQCGWPVDRIARFPNKAKADGIESDIADLIHKTSDVLLFYYVGHGLQLASAGDLGLALTDTSTEPHLRRSTSLTLSSLREMLDQSHCRIKLVILDCCYAGVATRNRQSAENRSVEFERAATVEGAYTWTAARWHQSAIYQDGEDGLTYFTKVLADVIETGIPGKPARLTLKDIDSEHRRRYLRLEIPKHLSRPAPARLIVDDADRFVFAINAAPVDSDSLSGSDNGRVVEIPDPTAATPHEYVDQLEELMQATGNSFRSLAARAHVHGDELPAAATKETVKISGSRNRMPPRPLVRALVRACLCVEPGLPSVLDEAQPPRRDLCGCLPMGVETWLRTYDAIAGGRSAMGEQAAEVWHRFRNWRAGNKNWTAVPGTGGHYAVNNSVQTLKCATVLFYGSRASAAKALADLLARDRHDAAVVVAEGFGVVEPRAASAIRQLAEDDPAAAVTLFHAVAEFSNEKAVRLFQRAGVPIPPTA